MPRGVFIEKRQPGSFTIEFKAKAVQLVRSSGKSVTMVAADLDLAVSASRSWVRQAEVDEGGGKAGALTSDEKSKLAQLRAESRGLKKERKTRKTR